MMFLIPYAFMLKAFSISSSARSTLTHAAQFIIKSGFINSKYFFRVSKSVISTSELFGVMSSKSSGAVFLNPHPVPSHIILPKTPSFFSRSFVLNIYFITLN